uniref:BAH domain-containing protein n=1 Tax=Ananas comosus var. bracteatus TaxID=296719 RepID=A0A6V7PVM2_ANACO|nr:unnamed protein product [Ananas comosus var. bracteatus]
MGKRRFTHVYTSDEEDEREPKRSQREHDDDDDDEGEATKRKGKSKKQLRVDDDEEAERARERERDRSRSKKRRGGGGGRAAAADDEEAVAEEEDEEDGSQEDAKPIGDVVRVSGKGRKKKKHYASFEYDGNVFELEDPVLLTPEDKKQKPYVAIIKVKDFFFLLIINLGLVFDSSSFFFELFSVCKISLGLELFHCDITQDIEGNLMVTGQWFYRPEEAEKRCGGSWQARDTRELFYSFHLDDVPAESVMHKCVVHFVPLNKKLPLRSEHPGFIVQKVYDTVERKLWKLTDKDYEDNKQHEIDLLVQKTRRRLGELPDVEPEENASETVEQLASKRTIRRKLMNPIDVSRADDSTTRSDHLMKADTPGSCTSDTLKYNAILSKFKALTGDSYRDKWLDKLLQGIRVACSPKEDVSSDDKMSGSADDSTKVIPAQQLSNLGQM